MAQQRVARNLPGMARRQGRCEQQSVEGGRIMSVYIASAAKRSMGIEFVVAAWLASPWCVGRARHARLAIALLRWCMLAGALRTNCRFHRPQMLAGVASGHERLGVALHGPKRLIRSAAARTGCRGRHRRASRGHRNVTRLVDRGKADLDTELPRRCASSVYCDGVGALVVLHRWWQFLCRRFKARAVVCGAVVAVAGAALRGADLGVGRGP